jgi:hypothetical protein
MPSPETPPPRQSQVSGRPIISRPLRCSGEGFSIVEVLKSSRILHLRWCLGTTGESTQHGAGASDGRCECFVDRGREIFIRRTKNVVLRAGPGDPVSRHPEGIAGSARRHLAVMMTRGGSPYRRWHARYRFRGAGAEVTRHTDLRMPAVPVGGVNGALSCRTRNAEISLYARHRSEHNPAGYNQR